jgi:hypothetical protein
MEEKANLPASNLRRARSIAAATSRDIARFLEWLLPHREDDQHFETSDREPLDTNAAEAVEQFTLRDLGFKVAFRVAIEVRTYLPHISAVASFGLDEKRWEIDAVRVTERGGVRIAFDGAKLQGEVLDAAAHCDGLI